MTNKKLYVAYQVSSKVIVHTNREIHGPTALPGPPKWLDVTIKSVFSTVTHRLTVSFVDITVACVWFNV